MTEISKNRIAAKAGKYVPKAVKRQAKAAERGYKAAGNKRSHVSESGYVAGAAARKLALPAAAVGLTGTGIAMERKRQDNFYKSFPNTEKKTKAHAKTQAKLGAIPIAGPVLASLNAGTSAKSGRELPNLGRTYGRSMLEGQTGALLGGAVTGIATRGRAGAGASAASGIAGHSIGSAHGAYAAGKNAGKRGDLKKNDGFSAFGVEHVSKAMPGMGGFKPAMQAAKTKAFGPTGLSRGLQSGLGGVKPNAAMKANPGFKVGSHLRANKVAYGVGGAAAGGVGVGAAVGGGNNRRY